MSFYFIFPLQIDGIFCISISIFKYRWVLVKNLYLNFGAIIAKKNHSFLKNAILNQGTIKNFILSDFNEISRTNKYKSLLI